MRASNIWAPMGSVGTSLDEVRLGRELENAAHEARTAPSRDRARARDRVASLTLELARRMERGGREHLASAFYPR